MLQNNTSRFILHIVKHSVCERLQVLRGQHRHPAPAPGSVVCSCGGCTISLVSAADNISPVSMSAHCIQTLPANYQPLLLTALHTVKKGGGVGFVQTSYKVTPPRIYCGWCRLLLPAPCCSSQYSTVQYSTV